VFKAHRLVYHSTLGWRVIKRLTSLLPQVFYIERSLSARSSRLFRFTHLTFDSLGPPEGEARRKD